MSLDKLLDNIREYNNNEAELQMINEAYSFAEHLHGDQKRLSGEPYIIHPLAVATTLSEIEADTNTIIAALLHDCLEDTVVKKEDIAHAFNPYVAMLVDGVTKISKINFSSKEDEIAGNTRKLLCGITEDIRIILIKLADRLHNMRTLKYHKNPEKQKENALETMEIFVPIAYYLGCYGIKSELEDLSFKYINPEMYYQLNKKISKIERNTNDDLHLMLNNIESLLNNEGIPNDIKFRVKNIYGIYKRIQRGNKLNEIHDLLSLKIMVNEISDCYLSLGLVHSLYPQVPGRFKDYIYSPKTNMYRSLHTTVFGEGENLVQTQIRTHEMEKIASLGLTVYWQDENIVMNDELRSRFQFFKSLVEINQSTSEDREFVEAIKQEILGTNIYVYTSKGEIIQLPKDSTPIDFAYKIHSDLGNTMAGAIVNGNYVEPTIKLQNKDIVKIIKGELVFGPREEWAAQCKTPLARKKINAFHDKMRK